MRDQHGGLTHIPENWMKIFLTVTDLRRIVICLEKTQRGKTWKVRIGEQLLLCTTRPDLIHMRI